MDRTLVYSAAFLRSLGTSTVGILIGIYFARLQLGPEAMGAVIGAGLAGNALAALAATLWSDRLGRRKLLAVLSACSAAGLAVVATRSDAWLLGAAAFVGMVNGVGRERGASVVIETAIVPSLADAAERTNVFAWYNVLGDLGHGLGAALAMLPPRLRETAALSDVSSIRATLGVCVACTLATLPLTLLLSNRVELGTDKPPPLSAATRRIVAKVSALFSLDALGGGFLTTAWLAWFFSEHFHADETKIGALFVAARLLNAVSHLVAAWLARKIGLVNTMVFTHIPSSIFLATVLYAPTFEIAAALFLVREGLSQMDVPTRQSYLMAIVKPEERVMVAGLTHLVRMGAWAVAPFAAGFLMAHVSIGSPFLIGAGLKIVYDLLLWVAFRHQKPPEEKASAGSRDARPA